MNNEHASSGARRLLVAVFSFALAGPGCDGDRGPAGPEGPPAPPPTEVERGQDLPGVAIAINRISGGSGPNGNLRVGDRPAVNFTVKRNDGVDLPLSALDYGGILLSGPSFNYQIVFPVQADLRTASVQNADGSWTYTLPPIPAVHAAPANDTASFGPGDGERTGQILVDGTYTVGIEAYRNYTVSGSNVRDAGNATQDFLFGETATTLQSREVSTDANCNACHVSLRAHGGFRRELKLCLLCHVSGAEDRNVDAVAGGTPGVSIDSRVMFHKIHDAAHLPSVLGVASDDAGFRDYTATPQPYQMVGFGNNLIDFSEISFPVWPNLSIPMPRDIDYNSLTTGQKATDDAIRMGAATCGKCHGDPDGSGPLPSPAQGGLAFNQPTRRACQSCHDDWDPAHPYIENGQVMGAQDNDFGCTASDCHPISGTALAVEDAHVHPLLDSSVNPGFAVEILSVEEAGTNDGDGTIDPGEKIRVTITVKDGAGNFLVPPDISSFAIVISGPAANRQILLNATYTASILSSILVSTQPYSFIVQTVSGGVASDFVVPDTYPATLNSSTDIDETAGDWELLPVAEGTYTIGFYGYRNFSKTVGTAVTAYRAATEPATIDFVLGGAASAKPEAVPLSGTTCESCHDRILFHGGGRQGFENCVLCHTVPGAEDRSQTVAANAPATPGVTIDFRTMLHKIHMGADLTNPSDYVVVGFGASPAPNNYTAYTYEEVGFPAFPSGTKDCESCHGRGTTGWQAPRQRNHPTGSYDPALVWTAVCGSCHDGADAQSHIAQQTIGGLEACDVCHGSGRDEATATVHHVQY